MLVAIVVILVFVVLGLECRAPLAFRYFFFNLETESYKLKKLKLVSNL